MGVPEKEFVFRNKYYFLETIYCQSTNIFTLCIDEYDNTTPENKALIQSHSFSGKDYTECVNKFEDARIFDGLTIYEAEQEIKVQFG